VPPRPNRRLTLAALAAALALIVVGGLSPSALGDTAPTADAAATWPGCAAFASQPQAQKRWVALGRPASADGDHDGKVCEDLPATTGSSTTTPCTKTKRVVDVGINRDKYPNVLAHARASIRRGWPRIMVLNRPRADLRRDRLLADIPTKAGFDRDEYPMAAGRGRGAAGLRRGTDPVGWMADVKYVPSGENRGAGSVVGIKLRRFCDGTRFRYLGY
jgi:hypothetical protein